MIYHEIPKIPLQNFLCFDIGTKKTGIANNFAKNDISFAIETINTENILSKIVEIKHNFEFQYIIIGLPTAYPESQSFHFITKFVEFLQKKLPNMNFIFWDEDNSSNAIRQAYKFGRKGFSKKFHNNYDMQVAGLILQNFLAFHW